MFASITVALLLVCSFLYELGSDAQARLNREEGKRLKKEAEENAATKARNEAEDRRLESERAKLASKARKVDEREKESQNHLTVSQLVIGLFIFITIAIAIILFFKNISSS